MSKLLHAGFIRYLKNISFYIGLLASVIIGIWQGIEYSEYGSFDENSLMGIFLAIIVVISISIGKEFSNGGFRNKVIIGHTKTKLFISEWIFGTALSILFFIACSIPTILINSADFAIIETEYIIKILVGMLLVHISVGAIVILICTIISHKAIAPIVSILLILGFLILASEMDMKLNMEKYQFDYVYDTETKTYNEIQTDEINPYYIDEPKRSIWEFTFKLLPQGQAKKYERLLKELTGYPNYDEVECVYMPRKSTVEEQKIMDTFPLYSLGLIVFLTAAGCFVFRKKELK